MEEAREAYEPEIVIELRSDTAEEMESNIERIEDWVKMWRKDHGNGDNRGEEKGRGA